MRLPMANRAVPAATAAVAPMAVLVVNDVTSRIVGHGEGFGAPSSEAVAVAAGVWRGVAV